VAAAVKPRVPDFHLWIVGDGPIRSALETQVRTLSLTNCVHFIGVQDEVANYMNAADIVALTSDTEGMPGVILEAGILRRPVVATRVGGVSECVLDGQTGILVEQDDETGFAKTLGDLLQRPECLRGLGDAAGKWVEENFTVSHIAEQYEIFYEDTLVRKRSQPSPPGAMQGVPQRQQYDTTS
jgi:glycosyltransferase involved in cell wall biosynthesis